MKRNTNPDQHDPGEGSFGDDDLDDDLDDACSSFADDDGMDELDGVSELNTVSDWGDVDDWSDWVWN